MTGRWNKYKSKKPLETSLGQAPKEPEKDLSHLRKPITTSIFGLKQVLSLFQTATNEVQEYITYECDVLYECRICRTIFRSLANFILHKRNYCREKFNNLGGANSENAGGFIVGEDEDVKSTIAEEEKSSPEGNENGTNESPYKSDASSESTTSGASKKDDAKKTILPIIDKLIKKQEINILAKNTLNEDFSSKAENSDDDVVFVSEENNITLQKIDTSHAAVFQTAVKGRPEADNIRSGLIKSEVMEIHGIFENNEAVLGSNGKVCNFETNKKIFKPNIPKQDLVCTECNFTFSTEKTLTHHIKYKHNKTCIVYPCPDCKETFANAWSVYRHLYKVHRRTSSQVRRMRAQIHSSGIRKDQEPEKKKEKKVVCRENEENQWMSNFEGDKDLQMCGGCGKRFERKAALHSHSQMCTKRIAVCNNINLKMKSVENKSKLGEKVEKNNEVKVVKGAAKRKPNLMFVQKISSNLSNNISEEKIDNVENKELDEITKEKHILNSPSINLTMRHNVPSRVIKIRKKIERKHDEVVNLQKLNSKGTFLKLSDLLSNGDSEKVTEVTSDGDEEKENSLIISEDKKINSESDVTITKYTDNQESERILDSIPEIEIFTISDDSCESCDKNDTVPTKDPLEINEEPPKEPNLVKSLKRKRSASCDSSSKTIEIPQEYKEYINDELDESFYAKAITYMDRDTLKCIPCQETFISQFQLLQHMSLHFSWFRFQCSKCPYVSFIKYDCTTHAYTDHGTPNNLIGCTVLPIPKWKVLCKARNFVNFNEAANNNHTSENVEVTLKETDSEDGKAMPHLEAITEETKENCDSEKNRCEDSESNAQTSSETIVLEDDDMPDICHDNAQSDTVTLSDEEMREQSNTGKQIKSKAGPSKLKESVALNRPIRNRIRSVKTLQNDFIYDLAKVLKLNDNSIKGGKVKKSLNKS